MPVPPNLDLGKLLRMQEMVTRAAQTEAVRDSAAALVHAYSGLRGEMLGVLAPDELRELREEFERLFQPLEEPEPFNLRFGESSHVRLASAAEEAQMLLRMVGGWVQGLINELTLEQKIRLEAEAKARLESKLSTGFGA